MRAACHSEALPAIRRRLARMPCVSVLCSEHDHRRSPNGRGHPCGVCARRAHAADQGAHSAGAPGEGQQAPCLQGALHRLKLPSAPPRLWNSLERPSRNTPHCRPPPFRPVACSRRRLSGHVRALRVAPPSPLILFPLCDATLAPAWARSASRRWCAS